ncbi:MAG: UDP-N-acetylglucosamine pyrophosphorylase [Myxococcota bacterium]
MTNILELVQSESIWVRQMQRRQRIARLLDQGVIIPCPETLELGDEVQLERIQPGVILHTGTRLAGAQTFLASGVELGSEGPVTAINCALAPGVQLGAGFFEQAVFLDRASTRAGAHIRAGTLLEEEASVAHCVGLKQTILFPFVTLGSLINFCDCLMAGGTSRKDHSEVGSGYIHFNFTPRGEKATPSLFGDVPRGVLLNQPRIFLGGLAATVGPTQIGYGAFLGPGQVYRQEVADGGVKLSEPTPPAPLGFDPKRVTGLGRKLTRNVEYLASLVALHRWYAQVRMCFADAPRVRVYEAALRLLEGSIQERMNQLERMMTAAQGGDADAPQQRSEDARAALMGWPAVQAQLLRWREVGGDPALENRVLETLCAQARPGAYLATVQQLDGDTGLQVTEWLRSLMKPFMQALPALRTRRP